MHKKMGYFNGFKFGVPIMLYDKPTGARIWKKATIRLVYEGSKSFVVLDSNRSQDVMSFNLSKAKYSYTPIGHTIDLVDSPMKPRFPVCVTRNDTAYCYKGNRMSHMAVEPTDNVNEVI